MRAACHYLSLRSLCVDALIELSDENADWKLSLNEFVNCLTPTYHPYERRKDKFTRFIPTIKARKYIFSIFCCFLNIYLHVVFGLCIKNVLWKMKCLRMEPWLRWSVTSVCVPVETGFAPLWPAMVGLHPHGFTKLKKCEFQLSGTLLSLDLLPFRRAS